MVIERYRKAYTEKKLEEAKAKQPETPEAPSVKDILNDRELSELLNLCLENEGKNELREKILNKSQLTEKEFEDLEGYRVKIKEVVDASNTILKILTPENIKIITYNSSEFGKIVGQLGLDGTKEFLDQYLKRLYILDYNGFEKLKKEVDEINKAQQNLTEIDKELKEKCEKYGISESELEKVFIRGEDLEELVGEHLTIIERIKNWWGGGKLVEGRAKELNQIENIKKELGKIDEALENMGEVIGDFVFSNEAALQYLSNELFDKSREEKTISFKEAANMMKPENLEEEWKKFLEEEWEEFLEQEIKKRDLTGEQINEGSTRKEIEDAFNQQKSKLRDKFINEKFKGPRVGIFDIIITMVEKWLQNK
ncbi:MAG: hypothetical protein ACP5JU_01095 [Minisyncoccia bacterium]